MIADSFVRFVLICNTVLLGQVLWLAIESGKLSLFWSAVLLVLFASNVAALVLCVVRR